MNARFELEEEPQQAPELRWAYVIDTQQHRTVAGFAPDHRDLAVELRDRLNVRDIADCLRTATAAGFRQIGFSTGPDPARPPLPQRTPGETYGAWLRRQPGVHSREFLGSLSGIPADRVLSVSEAVNALDAATHEAQAFADEHGKRAPGSVGWMDGDAWDASTTPPLPVGQRIRALPGTGSTKWLEGTVVTPAWHERVPVPGTMVYFRTDNGALRWAPADRVELLPARVEPADES